MARPRKEIDWKIFEGLCSIACTITEICAVFDIDDMTLCRMIKRKYKKSFSEIYKEKRSLGNVSLRRAQWRAAVEQGNTAMLIFLGKNRLGQTDKVEAVYVNKDNLVYERPETMK